MADTHPFTKGHGTENDFVLVPDLEGELDLSATQVARLADRRAGIGGDGVIRVVPTAAAAVAAVMGQASSAKWFMDYRNADGGEAEMCGNGTRVFAAYLRREGLETDDEFEIATRSGAKQVRFDGDLIAVDLGPWRMVGDAAAGESGVDALVHVRGLDPLPAVTFDLGNPHTVVALPDTVDLDKLDLTEPPAVNPLPLEGTNVEFVQVLAPGHIRMRVHERGVGETRSCGTGACAAALATRFWAGGHIDEWTVDVPGGRLRVRALAGSGLTSGTVELAGPAVLVADGTTTLL